MRGANGFVETMYVPWRRSETKMYTLLIINRWQASENMR